MAGIGLVKFGALAEITFTGINVSMGMVAVALGVIAGAIAIYNGSLENAREATEDFNRAQKEMNILLGEGGRGADERAKKIEEVSNRIIEKEAILQSILVENKKNLDSWGGTFSALFGIKDIYKRENEINILKREVITEGNVASAKILAKYSGYEIFEIGTGIFSFTGRYSIYKKTNELSNSSPIVEKITEEEFIRWIMENLC
jgi:hypothetical protein